MVGQGQAGVGIESNGVPESNGHSICWAPAPRMALSQRGAILLPWVRRIPSGATSPVRPLVALPAGPSQFLVRSRGRAKAALGGGAPVVCLACARRTCPACWPLALLAFSRLDGGGMTEDLRARGRATRFSIANAKSTRDARRDTHRLSGERGAQHRGGAGRAHAGRRGQRSCVGCRAAAHRAGRALSPPDSRSASTASCSALVGQAPGDHTTTILVHTLVHTRPSFFRAGQLELVVMVSKLERLGHKLDSGLSFCPSKNHKNSTAARQGQGLEC